MSMRVLWGLIFVVSLPVASFAEITSVAYSPPVTPDGRGSIVATLTWPTGGYAVMESQLERSVSPILVFPPVEVFQVTVSVRSPLPDEVVTTGIESQDVVIPVDPAMGPGVHSYAISEVQYPGGVLTDRRLASEATGTFDVAGVSGPPSLPSLRGAGIFFLLGLLAALGAWMMSPRLQR